MFPFILRQGEWVIPTFFFMIVVASLAATFYIYFRAPSKKLSQVVVLDIALLGTFFGILGARLFHVFVEYPSYYWEDPIRVFYFWQGGFVGYGVFIGILVSTFIYLKVRKLPVLTYMDLVALGCPLIVMLIRVGCIGAGCCYGKPTDFFIHFVFTDPASDAARDFSGAHLHATQLYDFLNALIVFVVIHVVDQRKKFEGQITLLFFMLYAFGRFFVELLRGDADRGVYWEGALSTSQITGIVIWLVGLPLYFYLSRRGKQPQSSL